MNGMNEKTPESHVSKQEQDLLVRRKTGNASEGCNWLSEGFAVKPKNVVREVVAG